jgi:hypothetical protein
MSARNSGRIEHTQQTRTLPEEEPHWTKPLWTLGPIESIAPTARKYLLGLAGGSVDDLLVCQMSSALD